MRQAVAHLSHTVRVAREETEVEKGWKIPTRRALLERMASQYQRASGPHKQQILARFMVATGYVRKYAMWVLNHAEEVLLAADAPHQRYGLEVQQALVLAWETLNRICAKRLIPFLPDIIESLEQNGHLHLSEESRRVLLSMSAATADRLLRSQRRHSLRSLSTTKAGSLLKQQISIRTFEDWNEAKPGFLEVDLVAHCGSDIEGSFLYTLTLTDVATGWTECLPLRNRGREEVLVALQRARTLIPFPILGIDTDNGGEFINEEVHCLKIACQNQSSEPPRLRFFRGRCSQISSAFMALLLSRKPDETVTHKRKMVVRQAMAHLSHSCRTFRFCFPTSYLIAGSFSGEAPECLQDKTLQKHGGRRTCHDPPLL